MQDKREGSPNVKIVALLICVFVTCSAFFLVLGILTWRKTQPLHKKNVHNVLNNNHKKLEGKLMKRKKLLFHRNLEQVVYFQKQDPPYVLYLSLDAIPPMEPYTTGGL